MDELIAFVKARLDEDEAAAREATADPGMAADWNETTSGCLDVGLPDHGGEDWRDYVWPQGDSRVTRFIARHDPARALREVEAKRAIVDEHSPHWPVMFPQPSGQPMCCVCDEGGFDPDPVDWPCPTVRHVAAVWSDHPDYRQEWAPQPQVGDAAGKGALCH